MAEMMVVPPIVQYIDGANQNYKKMKEEVFVYKECILVPFVSFTETKNHYLVSNDDYTQCILFKDNIDCHI